MATSPREFLLLANDNFILDKEDSCVIAEASTPLYAEKIVALSERSALLNKIEKIILEDKDPVTTLKRIKYILK